MRTLATILLVSIVCLDSAFAAMFGDFAVPDSLGGRPFPEPGRTDRVTVVFSLPSGKEMAIYFPREGVPAPQHQVLQTIAAELDRSRGALVYDLGGRPWFGTARHMDNGIALYDGRTHRNGIVYSVGFSFTGTVPDKEMLQTLSRIRLLPRLRQSPAAPLIVQAYEYFEAGDPDNMNRILIQADGMDPLNWVSSFLKGEQTIHDGDISSAAAHYQKAFGLFPEDSELAARYYAAGSYGDNTGVLTSHLHSLGLSHPEEPAVWEELGASFLAAGDVDRAAIYYNETLGVNPSSEAALYTLACIYAEKGEYEQSFRRGREFVHYRPWLPPGIVPDVSGAPSLGQARVQQLRSEPMPLGLIGQYTGMQSAYPQPNQTDNVIYAIPSAPVHQQKTYYPVITRDWRRHSRRRAGNGQAPSIGGGIFGLILDSIFEHDKHDRPNPPSGARPSRRPGRPGSRPGSSPSSDRDEGNRPRPPAWGNNRPGRDRPGSGRDNENRPALPDNPGKNKPAPPPARPERPKPTPAPKPETRPNPKPVAKPALKPTKPAPAPKPETRPNPKPVAKPALKPTKPAPAPKPEARPNPKPAAKPALKPAKPAPAPKPKMIPAPKKPALKSLVKSTSKSKARPTPKKD